MNSLFVIAPYDYEGLWVFDDERVGLEQEPFVGGADTMIDALVADIPDAKKGFRIVFSASAFPGYTQKLDWVRPIVSRRSPKIWPSTMPCAGLLGADECSGPRGKTVAKAALSEWCSAGTRFE